MLRTLSNIQDEVILQILSDNSLYSLAIFPKKAPSKMSDKVLNTPLNYIPMNTI